MEAAAFFLLIVALIAIALLGGIVYAIAIRLRSRKLHPAEDKVEGRRPEAQRGRAGESERSRDGGPEHERPEHAQVESEQHSRFVGSR
jgi:hypothetical protein